MDQNPSRVIPLEYAPPDAVSGRWKYAARLGIAAGWLFAVAAWVLVVFVTVESVIVTGPILCSIGVFLVVSGVRVHQPRFWVSGVAHCTICVLFFGLVKVLRWGPDQARLPFITLGVVHCLLTFPMAFAQFWTAAIRTPFTSTRSDEMNADTELSASLRPLYHLELALGNMVLRVDRNAWSDCPLAVVFRDPLHFDQATATLTIPQSVRRWENRDSHYDLEAGWRCDQTRHSLSGPLP